MTLLCFHVFALRELYIGLSGHAVDDWSRCSTYTDVFVDGVESGDINVNRSSHCAVE